MRDQLLDSMDLERERGITIKLQPVRMQWKGHMLNLIDTPGHIDFSYEVSRSLAAVEGALLLVDASQGIEAQTLANLYLAIEQNLTIIPVINKIDLPAADVEKTRRELVAVIGCTPDDILLISAKTGKGVEQLLDAIIQRIPESSKQGDSEQRSLIFDAQYNEFKGVVIYVRLFGGILSAGDSIQFLKTKDNAEVIEVGYFLPSMTPSDKLYAGDIGYLVTNVKNIDRTKVGDTIVPSGISAQPLKGYRDVVPMVFAGLYPADGSEHDKLRKAMLKLKLNDSSLTFAPDHSDVLGFGFRCGFLGLLHLDIVQERLKREFDLALVITAPTVAYRAYLTSGNEETITAPSSLPDVSAIDHMEEPIVSADLITPKKYLGPIMELIQKRRGIFKNTEFLDETRVIVRCIIPLNMIILDFYDSVKNVSSGYASYAYEFVGYQICDLVRLDFMIADELAPSLSILVPRIEVQKIARSSVEKLKKLIPKANFVIKIQATIGGKIIAAERISALRKDVTAKLYGGDVTRKRKLLEKQKKGKKKMASMGRVDIPQTAYLELLKRS